MFDRILRWLRPKPELEPEPKPTIKRQAITLSNNYGSIPDHLHQSWIGQNMQYNLSDIKSWNPRQALTIVNEDNYKPMTTNQYNAKIKTKGWFPYMFVNPMQDLDYMAIENLCRFTIGGGIIKQIGRMLFGTGFEPVLELKRPTSDSEKDVKTIEKHQYIIETLKEIDLQIEYDSDDAIDRSFSSKIASAINAMFMFNRSALIFGYEKPIEIEGKKYHDIPSSIKFAHPRDLGILQFNSEWRIEAVQWRPQYEFVQAKDMIYFWHEQSAFEVPNSEGYGVSLLSPMIDGLRLIRKLDGEDFPAMSEVAWASSFLAWIKPEGQTESERLSELGAIAKGITAGANNLIGIDPENVRTDVIDLHPQVSSFVELGEYQLRKCVSSLALPQSIFQDESQSNRATMLGKIQLATQTVIEPMREMVGDQFCKQWYQRWFRLIFGDDEVYDLFRIKIKWSDLKIEQPSDKIEGFNVLNATRQFSIKGMGEYLGMPDIASMLEPGKPMNPGGVQPGMNGNKPKGTSKKLNKDTESKEDRL